MGRDSDMEDDFKMVTGLRRMVMYDKTMMKRGSFWVIINGRLRCKNDGYVRTHNT